MNAVFNMHLLIARTFLPSVRIWVVWYKHSEMKSFPVKTVHQNFESYCKISRTEPDTVDLGSMMKKTQGTHSIVNILMIWNLHSFDCLLLFYVSILFPQNGNLPQIRMFIIQYLCPNTIEVNICCWIVNYLFCELWHENISTKLCSIFQTVPSPY